MSFIKFLKQTFNYILGIAKELASTKKLVEAFDAKLKEKDREIVLLKENNNDLTSKFEKQMNIFAVEKIIKRTKKTKNELQKDKEQNYKKLEDYVVNKNDIVKKN